VQAIPESTATPRVVDFGYAAGKTHPRGKAGNWSTGIAPVRSDFLVMLI
jgi:hypothetical protein